MRCVKTFFNSSQKISLQTYLSKLYCHSSIHPCILCHLSRSKSWGSSLSKDTQTTFSPAAIFQLAFRCSKISLGNNFSWMLWASTWQHRNQKHLTCTGDGKEVSQPDAQVFVVVFSLSLSNTCCSYGITKAAEQARVCSKLREFSVFTTAAVTSLFITIINYCQHKVRPDQAL